MPSPRDPPLAGRPVAGRDADGATPAPATATLAGERPLRLHVEAHPGSGPPALLVHGLLSSRAQWLPNLPALGSVCRPVVVELLGHGRSPSPEDPAAYRSGAYVAEFERIRRALGAERWFVCGLSLGAALTLRYALDHPDRVLASAFTNSTSALADRAWAEAVRPRLEEDARRLDEAGAAAVEAHPLNPARVRRVPPEAQRALAADVARHDPRGVAMTLRHTVATSPVGERMAENRVPTLLVAGEREAAFSPVRRHAEATVPRLEVVGLDAGHAVNLQDPAGFDAAVTAFYRRFSP